MNARLRQSTGFSCRLIKSGKAIGPVSTWYIQVLERGHVSQVVVSLAVTFPLKCGDHTVDGGIGHVVVAQRPAGPAVKVVPGVAE